MSSGLSQIVLPFSLIFSYVSSSSSTISWGVSTSNHSVHSHEGAHVVDSGPGVVIVVDCIGGSDGMDVGHVPEVGVTTVVFSVVDGVPGGLVGVGVDISGGVPETGVVGDVPGVVGPVVSVGVGLGVDGVPGVGLTTVVFPVVDVGSGGAVVCVGVGGDGVGMQGLLS